MSYWNYRIVRRQHEAGEYRGESFGLHEVYYDKSGRITGITVDPVACKGCESPQEVVDELMTMLSDARTSVGDVLTYEDYNGPSQAQEAEVEPGRVPDVQGLEAPAGQERQ